MANKIPEINASSTADIAFLLLVFFLVTTTMDTDTGLARMLPPMPPPDQKEQQTDVKVNKRNVLAVLVNKSDRLLVNGEPMDITQLKNKAKEFVTNPSDNPNMSERETKNIEGLGEVVVSKGVVSLQNDRGTSYETYIAVQNELIAAYNDLRNEYAMARFGKKFDLLLADDQDLVKKVYPQRISEAEPKNIGGK